HPKHAVILATQLLLQAAGVQGQMTAPTPRFPSDDPSLPGILPCVTFDFTYISLGAGVQSTALVILSALGLHGCPKADCAIFADTQDEPAWVYDHLNTLTAWAADHGLPVHVTTKGCLSRDVGD